MIERVKLIAEKITMSLFGQELRLTVAYDKIHGIAGRIFLQVTYDAPCTKSGELQNWNGRKWYLSGYMTDDEIVKTAYCAFEAAVKHEIMEGFKFDGIIVFNPHINYLELLKISHKEIKREAVI
jgi:hypothetical protein